MNSKLDKLKKAAEILNNQPVPKRDRIFYLIGDTPKVKKDLKKIYETL